MTGPDCVSGAGRRRSQPLGRSHRTYRDARPVTEATDRNLGPWIVWMHDNQRPLFRDKAGDENWCTWAIDLESGDVRALTPQTAVTCGVPRCAIFQQTGGRAQRARPAAFRPPPRGAATDESNLIERNEEGFTGYFTVSDPRAVCRAIHGGRLGRIRTTRKRRGVELLRAGRHQRPDDDTRGRGERRRSRALLAGQPRPRYRCRDRPGRCQRRRPGAGGGSTFRLHRDAARPRARPSDRRRVRARAPTLAGAGPGLRGRLRLSHAPDRATWP